MRTERASCSQVPFVGRAEYTLIDINDEGFVSTFWG